MFGRCFWNPLVSDNIYVKKQYEKRVISFGIALSLGFKPVTKLKITLAKNLKKIVFLLYYRCLSSRSLELKFSKLKDRFPVPCLS